MKLLIRSGCIAAMIYLQSCGGSMVKNTTDTVKSSSAVTTGGIKVPVPEATDNHTVKDVKDLTGYWVGWFTADKSIKPYNGKEAGRYDYNKKINISIDQINGVQVSGHSVVAGNIRPFSGSVEKEGSVYHFSVKEPGDDKNDGVFSFSIAIGDTAINGTWIANGKIKIPGRKYELSKKSFRYDRNVKLTDDDGKYVEWTKSKALPVQAVKDTSDEEEYTPDAAYYTTSTDVNKYNASAQLITKEEAANLKKADLYILRNAIYARHGYAFKKPELREYFDLQDWYVPITTDVRGDLTALEKKNIVTLMRYERNAQEYYDVFGR